MRPDQRLDDGQAETGAAAIDPAPAPAFSRVRWGWSRSPRQSVKTCQISERSAYEIFISAKLYRDTKRFRSRSMAVSSTSSFLEKQKRTTLVGAFSTKKALTGMAATFASATSQRQKA